MFYHRAGFTPSWCQSSIKHCDWAQKLIVLEKRNQQALEFFKSDKGFQSYNNFYKEHKNKAIPIPKHTLNSNSVVLRAHMCIVRTQLKLTLGEFWVILIFRAIR